MVYHPFRHLGLKFLSVAIAVGLWFVVAGEQTVERSLKIPLELANPPENLVQVENTPALVDVRVRGGSGLLSTLSGSNVVAVVDLSTFKAGQQSIHLTPRHVRAPFGVEAVDVTPSSITLRFETLVKRTVQVVPEVEGEPARGFVRGEVRVDPQTVEAAGPESAMRGIKQATTDPVSISGSRVDVSQQVTIVVPDAKVRLVTAFTANVFVPIRPELVEKRLSRVRVRVRNVGRGLSPEVTPASVTLVVRGPRNVVGGLGPDAVSAFVDLADLRPGRHNPPVRTEPLPDLEVVRIEPATVQVRIR